MQIEFKGQGQIIFHGDKLPSPTTSTLAGSKTLHFVFATTRVYFSATDPSEVT